MDCRISTETLRSLDFVDSAHSQAVQLGYEAALKFYRALVWLGLSDNRHFGINTDTGLVGLRSCRISSIRNCTRDLVIFVSVKM